MLLRNWVRLPSEWIQDGGLCELEWGAGVGSDNTAALMVLMAIAHHADDESGVARLTYDQLCNVTNLSRAKVANGLGVLSTLKLIERCPSGKRSLFALTNYDRTKGWAKLPAKRLYASGSIAAFHDFHLRNSAELNALKLYFLFVARRGNDTNMANISYDKIEEYTGLDRYRIKRGLTVLGVNGLVHWEQVPSKVNIHGVANAYRVVGIESHRHMGTFGRSLEASDFD